MTHTGVIVGLSGLSEATEFIEEARFVPAAIQINGLLSLSPHHICCNWPKWSEINLSFSFVRYRTHSQIAAFETPLFLHFSSLFLVYTKNQTKKPQVGGGDLKNKPWWRKETLERTTTIKWYIKYNAKVCLLIYAKIYRHKHRIQLVVKSTIKPNAKKLIILWKSTEKRTFTAPGSYIFLLWLLVTQQDQGTILYTYI